MSNGCNQNNTIKILDKLRARYISECKTVWSKRQLLKSKLRKLSALTQKVKVKVNKEHPKFVAARKSTTIKKSTISTKSKVAHSLISRGNIFCVNQMKNDSPYWGGQTCDAYTPHHGDMIQWVCSSCVAKMMPAPEPRYEPKRDPITGEKRKRGRPRKNPMKVVKLDENGQPVKGKRGRPKGTKNKQKINQ